MYGERFLKNVQTLIDEGFVDAVYAANFKEKIKCKNFDEYRRQIINGLAGAKKNPAKKADLFKNSVGDAKGTYLARVPGESSSGNLKCVEDYIGETYNTIQDIPDTYKSLNYPPCGDFFDALAILEPENYFSPGGWSTSLGHIAPKGQELAYFMEVNKELQEKRDEWAKIKIKKIKWNTANPKRKSVNKAFIDELKTNKAYFFSVLYDIAGYFWRNLMIYKAKSYQTYVDIAVHGETTEFFTSYGGDYIKNRIKPKALAYNAKTKNIALVVDPSFNPIAFVKFKFEDKKYTFSEYLTFDNSDPTLAVELFSTIFDYMVEKFKGANNWAYDCIQIPPSGNIPILKSVVGDDLWGKLKPLSQEERLNVPDYAEFVLFPTWCNANNLCYSLIPDRDSFQPLAMYKSPFKRADYHIYNEFHYTYVDVKCVTINNNYNDVRTFKNIYFSQYAFYDALQQTGDSENKPSTMHFAHYDYGDVENFMNRNQRYAFLTPNLYKFMRNGKTNYLLADTNSEVKLVDFIASFELLQSKLINSIKDINEKSISDLYSIATQNKYREFISLLTKNNK